MDDRRIRVRCPVCAEIFLVFLIWIHLVMVPVDCVIKVFANSERMSHPMFAPRNVSEHIFK
jgi:hypothetical protein